MNFSDFFVGRPRFAVVLSIIIFVAGLIALPILPIAEYPEVVPPTVVVRTAYAGADPAVIAETVAAPLEQSINGVEGMLYQSSQATADGAMALTVTFALGVDPDKAQVLVQNRVAQVLAKLPPEVQRVGVTTTKASPTLIEVVHLTSSDDRYDMGYLASYAQLHVKDALARSYGVGDVQMFGQGPYSMRIWLDPEKLASRSMTPGDVVAALREQNVQVAAGQVGAPPAPGQADFQISVNTQGRLETEQQFGDIVIRAGPQGEISHLRDVARIELGSDSYALRALLDNKPAIAMPVFQRPGTNALQMADGVKATMEKLKKDFPEGIEYHIVYNTTGFVHESIDAVLHTLFEALFLVVLVVVLFLQNWRASIIPLAAVPVSLVGTFAVLLGMGFGLNALTLFGLVLAIGIVVDDAIVVVENVERNIALGLSPRDATRKAMREVTGPIISTALVLCAVFIPTAFITGLTGQFYRQFALTIAISTVISAFNSLTLSPALAAVLLRPHDAPKDRLERLMERALGWLFRPFNRGFAKASASYVGGVGRMLGRSSIALVIYGVLIGFTVLAFARTPGGFVPQQDKLYVVAVAQLPDAATIDRTEAVVRQMSAIALKTPGVTHAVAFPGLSVNGLVNSPNAGAVFIPLENFDKRKSKDLSADAIAKSLNEKFAAIPDAQIAVFPPPPVQGLGTIGGFRMQIQDTAGLGPEALNEATQKVIAAAAKDPSLTGVFSSYQIGVPKIRADVDREKARAQGVALGDLYETMQVYLGSLYVNDFNRFGRTYPVNVQADQRFRLQPEDILRLQTRNAAGQMIPLGAFVTTHETTGPERTSHYNGSLTAEINAGPAVGYSTGQAQTALEEIAKRELPNGMSFEWTELTYQQILAGNTAIYVFPICVLLAFLVLVAQYESWTLPLVVILIVPMCLLCALVGVGLVGGDNNVFTQIGLIVLVGLACKNAILIVEFARERELEGDTVLQAVLAACRLRLRPILMTSLAFIMGVAPLVISTGAGAEMRRAMGVAVFSGMLGVTVFGLVFTPVFYWTIRRLAGGKAKAAVALPAAEDR
ncbi:MAG: efflux RND transporter permease subunit [Alphaproteobacteria bacterium]|nr:efflux RND transporter permease subunit [Alphaproteobacteria bacterium]MBU1513104.1 efflux RND transporter permease subunit [Alphaproteobacteria bacterium]MBU2095212.1 efflux RND transporter permease subunit [Alphaproteobacteria bacterium]MBU2150629.1 efflux RND transporter permease subunit [Alphaproteobacteria bacterium]MBU2306112.1 efflux RND transporter permease subunit [Alphaproteobacteria bacterium]